MADASLWISITALILSSATALVGLILTWVNHRKSFDPIIVIDKQPNKRIGYGEICLKNVGRGTAYRIELVLIMGNQDNYFESNPIDILPQGDIQFIEDKPFLFLEKNKDTKVISEKDLFHLSFIRHNVETKFLPNAIETVLVKISYFNEDNRRKTVYFKTWVFDYFASLSKKQYKSELKHRKSV